MKDLELIRQQEMRNAFRSFNPSLVDNFKAFGFPKYQYGYRHIMRPQSCQDIIDKLNLKSKYPNSHNLDIVDVFSGYGLLSSMINYELKPRKHVIIEDTKENVHIWEERIKYLKDKTGNKENFELFPHNGYNWSTFEKLINEDKVIQPQVKPRDEIHDELLLLGNLTPQKFGESLLAQWIMCSVYQNWLQKYGRIRMICLVPEATAQKFLSGARFPKRNKSAIKRELFTDSKLVGIVESNNDHAIPDGNDFDPNLLVKDQPYLIPSRSILPVGALLAVIEIDPKNIPPMDFDMMEYILQILMYKSTGKLSEALAQLAPGAEIDLAPKIPQEILNKCPRDLLAEEILIIFNAFDKWAFKPSLTDTIGIVQEDTRTF